MTRNFQSCVVLEMKKINIQNLLLLNFSVNINRMEIMNQWAETVIVSNFLAKKDNNSIVKRTQIKFQNRLIILQDKYTFQFQSNQVLINDSKSSLSQNIKGENIQKVQIKQINKNSYQENQVQYISSQSQPSFININEKKFEIKTKNKHIKFFSKSEQSGRTKRDTKNIPRNIIRRFIKYVEKSKEKQEQKLIQLSQKVGFNNTLIQMIIKDKTLNRLFKSFLKTPVLNWIQKGKTKDKQSHLEAIKLYIEMIESKLAKQQIVQDNNSGVV